MEFLREMIEKGEVKEIEILPSEGKSNLKKKFAIAGPIDGPYEGYWFRVSLDFTKDYPYRPPTVTMIDKIWGPYFDDKTGEVCMDILDETWTPSLTTITLLQSIISLLSEKNIVLENSTFLNPQAVILKKTNQPQFDEEVKKFCQNNHFKKQEIYNDAQR